MLNSFLRFVDEVLTTMDVEALNTALGDVIISETVRGSPEWKRLLGKKNE